ncbi:PglL family O-oligosaccharyltransferase [Pseudomonas sp. PDM13]|uniref:PglL family O-oligosaccharyltransferase n=1 Tax=Pseudomonas sp. PDM13 TaxID=2769255 RepID=UPI0021DF5402|nr:O-antigen ligase family protein [Pseudomonas sp. PDM13]MCU9946769.1 Wzy polymerase domain-containing protein [Pseudomonas sp. PDM13]
MVSRSATWAAAAAILLMLMGWLLPNHYSPWLTAYQDFSSFAALIVLSVFLLIRRDAVAVPKYVLPIALVAFLPLLQLGGRGYFSGDAWITFFYLLGFGWSLIVGFNLGFREGHSTRFFVYGAWCLLLGAVLSGLIALGQWLEVTGSIWFVDMKPGGRPFANFGQPNNLALLLMLGLVAAWYLFEARVVGRYFSAFVSVLLLFAIALTQSRTPWVFAAAAIVFWAWKSRYVGRLTIGRLMMWVALYIVFVFGLPYISDFLLLPDIDPLKRAAALERLGMWSQLFHAVINGPLSGFGWNQVSVAQVSVTLAYPLALPTEHSHNVLLDILVWNGPVVGAVLIALLMSGLAWLGVRARRIEGVLGLLACGALITHGMLEYPLDYGFFLLPLGLILGGVSADCLARSSFHMPKWLLAGGIAVGGIIWGLVWNEYRAIEDSYRQIRFESARLAQSQGAIATPEVFILTQLREYLRFARTYPHPDMSDEELEWMRKVAYRYPYPSSIYRYALASGLNGKTEQAKDHLRILQLLHGNVQYREGLGVMRGLVATYPQLGDVVSGMPD